MEPFHTFITRDPSTTSPELTPDQVDAMTLTMLQALFHARMEVNVRDKRYHSMRDIAQASNISPFTLCCQYLMEKEQAANMKPLPLDRPIPSEFSSLQQHSYGESENRKPRWWKSMIGSTSSSPTSDCYSFQNRDQIYEVSEDRRNEELSPREQGGNHARCCIIS